MIYALDLRAIWLLPVFWVDIPADRLSFVLEGKQNACWFYSNGAERAVVSGVNGVSKLSSGVHRGAAFLQGPHTRRWGWRICSGSCHRSS